jgi:Spy/CpxP family protein refolding chaperone
MEAVAYATGLPDPTSWRQAMLARGPAVSVDQALAGLTKNLELTPDQAVKIRPILQAHHDRIRNILEIAPAVLTHDEFKTQVYSISAETHEQINALLTDRQRAPVNQLKSPARL